MPEYYKKGVTNEKAKSDEESNKAVSIENIKIKLTPQMKNIIKAIWIHENMLYVICKGKNVVRLTKHFSQKYNIPAERVRVGVFYDLIKEISERNTRVLKSVRDGKIIYDPFKFIISLKQNIQRGLMTGTKEAILRKFLTIRENIRDIENVKIQVLDNTYTSLVESAQAALIMKDQKILIPRLIPDLLRKHLQGKGLEKTEINYAEEIIKTFKDYEHRKISVVSGKKLDDFRNKLMLFREAVKKIV